MSTIFTKLVYSSCATSGQILVESATGTGPAPRRNAIGVELVSASQSVKDSETLQTD